MDDRDIVSALLASAEAEPTILLCVSFDGTEVPTPSLLALHIVIAKSKRHGIQGFTGD